MRNPERRAAYFFLWETGFDPSAATEVDLEHAYRWLVATHCPCANAPTIVLSLELLCRLVAEDESEGAETYEDESSHDLVLDEALRLSVDHRRREAKALAALERLTRRDWKTSGALRRYSTRAHRGHLGARRVAHRRSARRSSHRRGPPLAATSRREDDAPPHRAAFGSRVAERA
jgi:hypothetical protein